MNPSCRADPGNPGHVMDIDIQQESLRKLFVAARRAIGLDGKPCAHPVLQDPDQRAWRCPKQSESDIEFDYWLPVSSGD